METTSSGTVTFANGFFSGDGHLRGQGKLNILRHHHPRSATSRGIPQSVTSSATISKAPLKATATTFSGFEGRSATVNVANFTAATSTSASNFTASINWGDGKTTTGTIVKDATGKYHVAASHAYAEEQSSPYTVKVTIKQSGGATVSVNSKGNIADSPLDKGPPSPRFLDKDSTFSNKTLGTFRDQDALNKLAGDYEGTIDWGDGSKSAASFIFTGAVANTGSFWKVTGSHKYALAKTFTVKITIDDTGSPRRARSASRRQVKASLGESPANADTDHGIRPAPGPSPTPAMFSRMRRIPMSRAIRPGRHIVRSPKASHSSIGQ